MTDSYRQRIGGVVGLRDTGHAKLEPHHLLYLLLAAGAVVGDPLLYLRRCVFESGDTFAGCGEEGNCLGATDSQCRPDVLGDEWLLYGDGIGLMTLDYFEEFLVEAI